MFPIRRMLVYRHGVSYFERQGSVSGNELRLTFPQTAMDDILKSLLVIDQSGGQILGIDIETPESRIEKIKRRSINLSQSQTLIDLLRDLRGRRVRLSVEGRQGEEFHEGAMIGINTNKEEPLGDTMVSLYLSEPGEIYTVPLGRIIKVTLLDERAVEDLIFCLDQALVREDIRSIVVRLTEGEHELVIGYIAPASSWRVSYRLLVDPSTDDSQAEGQNSTPYPLTVLLQGWGIFDNLLDEDLENIELTLVAGMPISFQSELYQPKFPVRERANQYPKINLNDNDIDLSQYEVSEDVEDSLSVKITGEDRDSLFQYRVSNPVSVERRKSAMVPIINQRLSGRKELVHRISLPVFKIDQSKYHPKRYLCIKNETGFTLESGTATVFDSGDYAGEAMLPFARPHTEIKLPYAIEFGVTIREDRNWRKVMAGLRIDKDFLVSEKYEVSHIFCCIISTLSEPVDVIIEQELIKPWPCELFDSPEPIEQCHNLARWRVHCSPHVETIFEVKFRAKNSDKVEIRNLKMEKIHEFLKRKYLDETTYAALTHILSIYEQIENQRTTLECIEVEQKKILARQSQIQTNLAALGREGTELVLRERYISELSQQEDRLNELVEREQQMHELIQHLEQEASQAIANLSES